jgi:hypothetical protein
MDELGHAINDSLSESEQVSEVMGRVRAAGYDLFLILEVTIGFNKRGEQGVVSRHQLEPGGEFRLTNQDAQFLRALKITVEDETS